MVLAGLRLARAGDRARLEAHGVEPVGRYARWHFQGIADSIRDGLRAGSLLREPRQV